MTPLAAAPTVYPLARNGVFATVQGEGYLAGLPSVFIRLAGCSVGCSHCDTDYRHFEAATAVDIASRVASLGSIATRWVWVTGGEPTDHDLTDLYRELRKLPRLSIALATSGCREVAHPRQANYLQPDYLSVSPHSLEGWKQRSGTELKLVFGLNGLRPSDALDLAAGNSFPYRFVAPEMSREGRCGPETVRECVEWVRDRPRWRMASQAHKQWGLA